MKHRDKTGADNSPKIWGSQKPSKKWKSSPTYIIAYFLGLAPFQVKDSHLQTTPWNIVYTLICCLLYLLVFAATILKSTSRAYPVIIEVGHAIHITVGFLLCVPTYIMCLIHTKQMNGVYQKLNQIDSAMEPFMNYSKRELQQSKLFRGVIFFGMVFFFVVASIFEISVAYSIYGEYVIVVCLSYIFPYMTAALIISQFVLIVLAICKWFEQINLILKKIGNTNTKSSELETGSVKTLIVAISAQRVIHPEKKLYQKLEFLFKLHDTLMDLSETVNQVYAIQIVIYTTAAFVIILYGFSFESKVVLWVWGSSVKVVLMAMSFILWGVVSAIVMYTVLRVCARTRDEAYKSAMMVHIIMHKRPEFMLKDEIYYHKMKSFTLQILHRKNDFNFNAIGLFVLDYTFIFSLVSAGASYLIVLLQFDISSDERFLQLVKNSNMT